MNRTFRIVFNRCRDCLVVADERTKSFRKKGAALVLAAAGLTAAPAALATTEPMAIIYDPSTVANAPGETFEETLSFSYPEGLTLVLPDYDLTFTSNTLALHDETNQDYPMYGLYVSSGTTTIAGEGFSIAADTDFEDVADDGLTALFVAQGARVSVGQDGLSLAARSLATGPGQGRDTVGLVVLGAYDASGSTTVTTSGSLYQTGVEVWGGSAAFGALTLVNEVAQGTSPAIIGVQLENGTLAVDGLVHKTAGQIDSSVTTVALADETSGELHFSAGQFDIDLKSSDTLRGIWLENDDGVTGTVKLGSEGKTSSMKLLASGEGADAFGIELENPDSPLPLDVELAGEITLSAVADYDGGFPNNYAWGLVANGNVSIVQNSGRLDVTAKNLGGMPAALGLALENGASYQSAGDLAVFAQATDTVFESVATQGVAVVSGSSMEVAGSTRIVASGNMRTYGLRVVSAADKPASAVFGSQGKGTVVVVTSTCQNLSEDRQDPDFDAIGIRIEGTEASANFKDSTYVLAMAGENEEEDEGGAAKGLSVVDGASFTAQNLTLVATAQNNWSTGLAIDAASGAVTGDLTSSALSHGYYATALAVYNGTQDDSAELAVGGEGTSATFSASGALGATGIRLYGDSSQSTALRVNASEIGFSVMGELSATAVEVSGNAELILGADASSTRIEVGTTDDSSADLYGIQALDASRVEVRGQELDIALKIGSNDGRNQSTYGIAARGDSQVALYASTTITAAHDDPDAPREFLLGFWAEDAARLALKGQAASSVTLSSNNRRVTLVGLGAKGGVEHPLEDLQFESEHDLTIGVSATGEDALAYGVFAGGDEGVTTLSFKKTSITVSAENGEAYGLMGVDAKVFFEDEVPLSVTVNARNKATGLTMNTSEEDANELGLYDAEIAVASSGGRAVGLAAADTFVVVNGYLKIQASSSAVDQTASAQALFVQGGQTILGGNVELKANGLNKGGAMTVIGAEVSTAAMAGIGRVALEADMAGEAHGLLVLTDIAVPRVSLQADDLALSATSRSGQAAAVKLESDVAVSNASFPQVQLYGKNTVLSAVSSGSGDAYGARFTGTGLLFIGDFDEGAESTRINATSASGDAYGVYAKGDAGAYQNHTLLVGETVTIAASAPSGTSYGIYALDKAVVGIYGDATVTADRPVYTDDSSYVYVEEGRLELSGNADGSIDGARFYLGEYATLAVKSGMAYAYTPSSGVIEEVTAARFAILDSGNDPGTLAVSDTITVTLEAVETMKALYPNARLSLENANLYVEGAATDVTIPSGVEVALLAQGDRDLAGAAGKITVQSGAALGVKADGATTKAKLAELVLQGDSAFGVADEADLALGSLTLEPSEVGVPIVYVGQNTNHFDPSDSAGRLSVDKLRLNGGTVFIDPAWKPGMTVGDASHFAVTSAQPDGLDGMVIAGANAVFAYGAANGAADAAFDALAGANGLTWSDTGVNALMFIAAPLAFASGTDAGVRVDPGAEAESDVTQNTVSVLGDNTYGASMLVIDQAGVGTASAIAGEVEFAGQTYLGVLVASDAPVTLAEGLVGEGLPTVVTDTPFYSASFDPATRQISFSFQTDKAAMLMASMGMQVMALEADRHLAQSVSQRIFSGVRLAAGTNAWADFSGQRREVDRYGSGARFKADTAYGAVGVDFPIGGDAFAGAALQFAHGTLRSGSASLKNKVGSAGVSFYAGRRLGDNLTVGADAAFTRGANDIEARVDAISGKRHVKTYAAGVSASYRVPVNAFFDATATAGLRLTRIQTDGFAIGSTGVARQKQDLVQVPLRFALEGSFTTANGASVAPSLGVAFTPSFGGRGVKAFGVKENVIDAFPVEAQFGLTFARDNLTAGAAFTAGAGTKGSSSIGAKLSLRYAF